MKKMFFLALFLTMIASSSFATMQDAGDVGVLDSSWSTKGFTDRCIKDGYTKKAMDCGSDTYPCGYCGSDSRYVKFCVPLTEYKFCKDKASSDCTYCEKQSGCFWRSNSTLCLDPPAVEGEG